MKKHIEQMLEIGIECGITTLEGCYFYYMDHYDVFFYIPDFQQNLIDIKDLFTKMGLMEEDGKYLKDISAKEALKIVRSYAL